MIFGHGDDVYRYGDKVTANFSSNIPTFADLSPLKEHLAQRLDVVSSYPEPQPRQLEEMIAEELGIAPQMVMVTAGATEAIYLIAQLYRGWAAIIPQPTFNEYADACRAFDINISYYDNDETELLPEERLYWLCNPNNPTGNVMLKDIMNRVVRQNRKQVFIIDQSYEDYTDKPLLKPSEMMDCHNVFILHSMSKRFCVPGIRLGYVTASPILISRLRQLRQPWTVSSLAIEAGLFLVGNKIEVLPDRQAYLEEARRLHQRLNEIDGLMLMDSDTNFMLAYLDKVEARQLKQWLIDNHGILIRDASNFHGLDNHCFRVSAQTPAENDALVDAIAEFLRGTSKHFAKFW